MTVADRAKPSNPRDSMKSTWRTDRSQWKFDHYVMHFFRLHPTDLDKPIAVHDKSDKMPYMTQWSANLWVIAHALWPMALQQAFIWYKGRNLHPVATFVLYMIAYQLNAVHQIQIMRRWGHKYGFLDGDKHERDQVPDVGVSRALHQLVGITTVRPLFTTFLTYRTSQAPSLSWWLPLELFFYSIILDFWFYLYHRSCHEMDTLWKYHRTHHLTKHPNVMLSSYADHEQEMIEQVIVPLLTYICLKIMGFPMGFYDCWMCLEFLLFSEAFGHSGIRVFTTPPGTSAWLLKLYDADLTTEDHDIHHRKGWRKSSNYGKQTRVWDRVFGTCGDRVESLTTTIDWNQPANFPLF